MFILVHGAWDGAGAGSRSEYHLGELGAASVAVTFPDARVTQSVAGSRSIRTSTTLWRRLMPPPSRWSLSDTAWEGW